MVVCGPAPRVGLFSFTCGDFTITKVQSKTCIVNIAALVIFHDSPSQAHLIILRYPFVRRVALVACSHLTGVHIRHRGYKKLPSRMA